MLDDAAHIAISRPGVRPGVRADTTASPPLWSGNARMAALHGSNGFGAVLCGAASNIFGAAISNFGDAR